MNRPEQYLKLREQLIKHEGVRLKPYTDTVGKLTIGVGRNLDDVGITQDEAMQMLTNDIKRVAEEVEKAFGWFKSLDTVRQDAILNMAFNVGLPRLQGFKKMLEALRVQNYSVAAKEALASKWATQVGRRAADIAKMLEKGIYP